MDFFRDREITKVDWLIIGVSLFLLVMVTLLYLFVSSTLNTQIAQLDTEIAETQKEVDKLRERADKRDALLKSLEEIKARVASFESRLPTDKEVPKLLDQFQKIAEDSGIKYQLIKSEQIVEDKDYSFYRIPFKIKVEAKYPELGVFLRSLEFGQRFIKVDQLKIDKEEEGDSEANFVISTYMFVVPEGKVLKDEVKQS